MKLPFTVPPPPSRALRRLEEAARELGIEPSTLTGDDEELTEAQCSTRAGNLHQVFDLKTDDALKLCRAFHHCEEGGDPEDVDTTLELANALLDGNGVIAVQGRRWHDFWQETVLLYVNMGDPYVPTICYLPRAERFKVMAWGDWIERHGDDEGVE